MDASEKIRGVLVLKEGEFRVTPIFLTLSK